MGRKIKAEDTARFKGTRSSGKSLDQAIDDFFAEQKPLLKGDKHQEENIHLGIFVRDHVAKTFARTKSAVKDFSKNALTPVSKKVLERISSVRLGIAVFALILFVIAVILFNGANDAGKKNGVATTGILGTSGETATNDGSLPRVEKQDFEVLLPAGKSVEELGGIVLVSPEGNDPVYAYLDTLEQAKLNISMQKTPAQLSSGAQTLEQLASGFQATKIIEIDGNRIYHGSTGKGVQSLIFVKNGLLVLIRSDIVLNDDTWAGYIVGFK